MCADASKWNDLRSGCGSLSQLTKYVTTYKSLLILKERINIIDVYNKQKLSVCVLADKFQIGKIQANIISKMGDVLQKWTSNVNVTLKRNHFKTEGFNKLTYDWFVKARNKNIR